jgi:hypothetical protein
METKICKLCNKEYPATSEFFHKDFSGKLGFKAKCKVCMNGEKFRFVDKGNHLCKTCGRDFPFTEEYFVINPRSKNLTSPCRECRGLKFGFPKYKKSTQDGSLGNKICIKCKKEFPLNKAYFLKKSENKDKFSSRCRLCDGTSFLDYNINIIIKEDEKICSKCKKVKNKFDFYKDSSKEDNLSTQCKRCIKEHMKNNKDKRNINCKNKRKNNPNFRIKNNLRCRISAALKGKVKSKSTIKLLGCSIEHFIKYLENKMSIQMNWDNYGIFWHVDHIVPCVKFDLSIQQQQNECFNYKNMQPLFAKDNLTKQGYSILKVIYKSSKDYENNNFIKTNNCIIDER